MATTERQYKNEIVKRMKALGVYKDEFSPTIDRTAALYVHRDKIETEFAASGGNAVVKHTNKAGATNAIKNPFLSARDEVYSQLLAHERELGLTPSALKKINEASMKPKRSSSLADALKALGG
jgi:phage terminase small subunit